MFDSTTLLVLVPALPLIAALLTAILGPRLLRQNSHLPVIVALLGSLLCSLGLLRHFQTHRPNVPATEATAAGEVARIGFEEVTTLWTWANISDAYAYPGMPADFGSCGSMRSQGCALLTKMSRLGLYQLGSSRPPA